MDQSGRAVRPVDAETSSPARPRNGLAMMRHTYYRTIYYSINMFEGERQHMFASQPCNCGRWLGGWWWWWWLRGGQAGGGVVGGEGQTSGPLVLSNECSCQCSHCYADKGLAGCCQMAKLGLDLLLDEKARAW